MDAMHEDPANQGIFLVIKRNFGSKHNISGTYTRPDHSQTKNFLFAATKPWHKLEASQIFKPVIQQDPCGEEQY